MPKGIGVIAKLNLKNIHGAYWAAIISALVSFVNLTIFYIIAISAENPGNSSTIAPGAFVYLLVLVGAITIPASCFRRVINLGGRRDNFFWGALTAYAIMAVAGSLVNTTLFYTFDTFIQQSGYFGYMGGVLNPMQAFGWTQNGFALAFLQQVAFLFLFAVFLHTWTSVQGRWYGWVTNVVIAAILAVFIPIAPLRATLVWFFNMIIFHDVAIVQIAACIVLAAVIYVLNRPIYEKKAI